ncbi:MAG: hypothetical protein ACK5P6_09250 [Pseudobdellovibrionaceae bacterium]
MKLKITQLLTIGTVGALMAACSSPESNNSLSVKGLQTGEEVSLAAEQLVTPHGFPYALKLFNLALEKDPENQRALFYKNALGPIATFEGILARVAPLAAKEGKTAALQQFIKSLPETEIKRFLTQNTQSAISNPSEVQNLVIEMRNSWESLRRHLRATRGQSLTLNLNPDLFQIEDLLNRDEFCKVTATGDGQYSSNCDLQNLYTVQVNSADKMALQQMAAVYSLYLGFLSNYNVIGSDALIEKIRSEMITPQEKLNLIHQDQKFLKLRTDSQHAMIKEMGLDAVQAARWIVANQRQICNPEKRIKRPGMLFHQGLCVDGSTSDTEKVLSLVEAALSGPVDQVVDNNGTMETLKIDYTVFQRGQLNDLKVFIPTQINACGEATQYKDMTFSGLMPEGAKMPEAQPCIK